jgi:threonine dehydratase
VKNIDAVVVPVGGGGLIAGVALAVKSLYPHIQGKNTKISSYTFF